MRIGVVEAVREDHLEIHAAPAPGEFDAVRAGCFERRAVADLNPLEAFHGENARGGALRDHGREVHGGIALEVLREAFEVAPLVGEVELAQERLLEVARRGDRLRRQ